MSRPFVLRAATVAVILTLTLAEDRTIAQTGERQAVLSKADQEAIAEFQKAVDDYVKLRDRVRAPFATLPKEATGQQIEQFELKVRQAIVTARAGARPGAIFRPRIQEYIRGQLKEVFSRPDGASVRASILDENPVGTAIRINGPYPENLPLTTMPPQMLEALPKLPMEVEYRFVGDRLILFDASVELVLDYIDRALPAVVRTR